uniref:hypothetical protein n=1 Tax=Candidatus Stercorousia sp. TaxID=3048886 RepID=UPI0040273AF9
MVRITKNNLLKYVPLDFSVESFVNPFRIFEFNDKEIKQGSIVYLMEREIRIIDNFALQFAIQKSNELNQPLKIICTRPIYEYEPKQGFIDNQINEVKKIFLNFDFNFEVFDEKDIPEHLSKLDISLLIFDFNPLLNRDYLANKDYKIYEIDGHNIVPARFLSDKQEYNAMTMRRKIYYKIFPFLTEYDNFANIKTEADLLLEDFIQNKLPQYAEFKNNPSKNVLSGLSKYMNLGFISSQRAAIEVIKSNAEDINKEVFLEELIIQKELSDNFCLYCRNYKTLDCIPLWAKNSLMEHENDLRVYNYKLSDFENAKTHDILWNATQIQLINDGGIHGYLRMYWAKKILEWSQSPQTALDIAIYLNDKYSYDSPSPSGYAGILWAIGALHDRAFRNFPVTGKIRRMTYDSLKHKFNIEDYISQNAEIKNIS